MTNLDLDTIREGWEFEAKMKLAELSKRGLLRSEGRTRAVYSPATGTREDATIPHTITHTIPLSAVSRVRGRSRAQREDIEAAILDCMGESQILRQIATAIGRSARTVRENYLPKLVAAGCLEPRFSDAPRHPDQAYPTKEQP